MLELDPKFAWYLTYVSLLALSLLIVVTFAVGKVWLYLKPFPKRSTFFIGGLILLLGLIFRLQQPFDHFIFHDEEANIHAAQMIREGYLSRDCDFGVFEKGSLNCLQKTKSVPIKKEGYPFMLALSSLFLGNNYLVIGILLNITFALGTTVLIFFIAKLLWSEAAGLLAAMMVSLLPLHIQWSATTSVEVSALFFVILGILFYILYSLQKKYFLFFLSVLTFNFAAFTRPEIIILLPLVVIFFLTNQLGFKFLLKKSAFLMSIVIFLSILVNVLLFIATLSFYKGYIEYENATSIYSLNFLRDNLINVIQYSIEFKEPAVLFSFFGIIASSFAILIDKRLVAPKVFILTLGLVLLVIQSSYYFGSYEKMGILHGRFPMMWVGILAPLTAAGIISLMRLIRLAKLIKINPNIAILGLCIISSVYIQINFQIFFQPPSQTIPFEERHVILQFQKENPNCLYVSPIAFREISNGYNAIASHVFQDYSQSGPIVKQKCIIIFDSYQCRWNKNDICRKLLEKYSWKKLPYERIGTWQLIP